MSKKSSKPKSIEYLTSRRVVSLTTQLNQRIKQLRKQYKQLEELKKYVLGESTITTCLIERLPEIFEKKYQEKYGTTPNPFHFSKDRVPPLTEEELMIGSNHLLDPKIDLGNFPRLLNLQEENYLKTAQEQKEAAEGLQRLLESFDEEEFDHFNQFENERIQSPITNINNDNNNNNTNDNNDNEMK